MNLLSSELWKASAFIHVILSFELIHFHARVGVDSDCTVYIKTAFSIVWIACITLSINDVCILMMENIMYLVVGKFHWSASG